MAAGARFIGGVFACTALAEHELTGAETYYGLTPIDTRSTPAEFMTQGWFTGLVPVTVPVDATSFAETARAAQESFDSGTEPGECAVRSRVGVGAVAGEASTALSVDELLRCRHCSAFCFRHARNWTG